MQIFSTHGKNVNKLHFECTGRLPIIRWSDRERLFVFKNTKSIARFMRAAQFASVSSCARCLLKHFRRKFLQIIRNTDDWYLTDSPVGLQLVLLTQDYIINCLNVFFSAGTARSAADWVPVNCACVPQLFQQLVNTTLCPAFVRKFVCQALCCGPLQMQTF